jgi:peptide/nickel transport system substrate-binding protein
MLESLGFSDADDNGYLDFAGAELQMTMIAPTWGLIPEVAQLLQDQWRDVGVRAIIEQVPSRNTLVERVGAGEYNLVAYYDFGVDPAFLNRYFLSDGETNWTGYTNADLDRLLRDAVVQIDPNARASLYAQAERLIMEQALILPIRDYVNLNGARATIEGLTFDAYGWFPLLHNVSISE